MTHLTRHPRQLPFEHVEGRFGLDPAYAALKLLGKGGTGQTWLCRNRVTEELVACKLEQRPIPADSVDMTLTEITVSSAGVCLASRLTCA